MQGTGTTTILPNAELELRGFKDLIIDQRKLKNEGIIKWDVGNIELKNGANIENTGIFDIKVDKTLRQGAGGGSFTNGNGGTVKKTAGAGTTQINLPFSNTGDFRIATGTVSFDADVTLQGHTYLEGGNLAGKKITISNMMGGMLSLTAAAGQIQVTELINNSTIDFGAAGVGTLTIAAIPGVQGSGKYTQGMMGRLTMNISGDATYSKLNVAGEVQLGGGLTVSLVGGYTPQGQAKVYTLMTFGSRPNPNTNLFDNEFLPPGFSTGYGATALTVTWTP